MPIGFVLSLIFALGRVSKNYILSKSIEYYIFVVRGTPLLVQIYLIYFGEAKKVNAISNNSASQMAFNAIRLIVLIGWAIYPIGYVLGNFGALGMEGMKAMNSIYNLADLVNKTAFGIVIWAAAKKDSQN